MPNLFRSNEEEAERALYWILAKQTGAVLLITLNLTLLTLAFRAYRQKASLPDAYYRVLPISAAVGAAVFLTGLSFLLRGLVPHGMHVFYGVMVLLGVTAQAALRHRTALGQRYRAKPLVHLFVALFVMLLTLRSWMAA